MNQLTQYGWLFLTCCSWFGLIWLPFTLAVVPPLQQQALEGTNSGSDSTNDENNYARPLATAHQTPWGSSTHPLDHNRNNSPKSLIDVSSISLALRLTCELNRRLQSSSRNIQAHALKRRHDSWQSSDISATSRVHFHGGHQGIQEAPQPASSHYMEEEEDQYHSSGGYGEAMVNVHPSQTWNPPISRLSWQEQQQEGDSSLTVFHSKSPREGVSGVLRWGPDLEAFISSLFHQCFQISSLESQSTLLTMAMIYLDRACSVETVRLTNDGGCPYLTPRTVHRLVLTAMTLAQRTLYHGTEQSSIRTCIEQTFGISPTELHSMEYLMLSAMGDYGTDIPNEQYHQFTHQFQHTFYRPQAFLQPPPLQQQQPPPEQHFYPQYHHQNGAIPPPPSYEYV